MCGVLWRVAQVDLTSPAGGPSPEMCVGVVTTPVHTLRVIAGTQDTYTRGPGTLMSAGLQEKPRHGDCTMPPVLSPLGCVRRWQLRTDCSISSVKYMEIFTSRVGLRLAKDRRGTGCQVTLSSTFDQTVRRHTRPPAISPGSFKRL